MTKIKIVGILSIGILTLGGLFPQVAAAAACPTVPAGTTNIGSNNQPGNSAGSTAFCYGSCGNQNVTITCMVVEVMRILSISVGLLVAGGITFGGILYSTSEGNPGKAQKGITFITNSVIGLLLYLLMFAIINFLVPGGIIR